MKAWVAKRRAQPAGLERRRARRVRRVGARARRARHFCRAISATTRRTGSSAREGTGWAWPGSFSSSSSHGRAAAQSSASASAFFSNRLPRWFPVPKVPADNPMTRREGRAWPAFCSTSRCCRATAPTRARAATSSRSRSQTASRRRSDRPAASIRDQACRSRTSSTTRRSDGSDRTWSLESQMEVPMYNEHPVEMGLKGQRSGSARTGSHADADYVDAFSRGVSRRGRTRSRCRTSSKRLRRSSACIVSADSAFDRYLYKDDHSGMSPAAKRGAALVFLSGPPQLQRVPRQRQHLGTDDVSPARCRPTLKRSFTTPAWPRNRRNSARRRCATSPSPHPYMHDGSIATLKEVVAHYAAGGRIARPKSDKVRGFAVSPAETDDLVAFLHTLTDEKFLANPAFSNPLSNPDLRAGRSAAANEQNRIQSLPCMADRVSLVILAAGCPWLRLSARAKSAELSRAPSRRGPVSTLIRLIDDKASVAAGQSPRSDAVRTYFPV